MTENEYIVQALGRIEERQIKNSEGIATINATMVHIVNDNADCKDERGTYDERLSEIEGAQRLQKGLIAAMLAMVPVASFAIDWWKK